MNKLMCLALSGALLVSISGCGKKCKQAQAEVMQPTAAVAAYLSTNPDADNVASTCPWILTQLQHVPDGADTIRKIADTRFTSSYSTCVYYATAYRLQCYYEGNHHQVCYEQPYTYCAQYEYHTVHDQGYETAIELSKNLDILFDKANHMCSQAASGNHGAALDESRQLLVFINGNVSPDMNRVYNLACTGPFPAMTAK